MIGREELIGDPRFETPAARAENADEVNAMIADWTQQHTKHEAMEIIGAAGVPAGAVLDTMELYNDQTFEQRGIMQTIEHPTVGTFKMAGMAGAVRRQSATGRCPRRCSGRTTSEVLSDWLGPGTRRRSAASTNNGVIG